MFLNYIFIINKDIVRFLTYNFYILTKFVERLDCKRFLLGDKKETS